MPNAVEAEPVSQPEGNTDAKLASVADCNESAFERLAELLAAGDVFVLTGAGVSTDSGIPDYRDERGEWKRPAPIQFREFTGSAAARQRYWARSLLGYEWLRTARPNAAHDALAALEAQRAVVRLVTQNVDGLHQAAGSRRVTDLHGRIDQVVCLGCGERQPRAELQAALAAQNTDFVTRAVSIAPDGDADLGAVDYGSFRVVDCSRCGGLLKPDVVFFGETVPRDRVEEAMSALENSRSLLVVGSSLMVFSGYRFVRAAERRGLPIAVINRGLTRADPTAALKLDAPAGATLGEVVRRMVLRGRQVTRDGEGRGTRDGE